MYYQNEPDETLVMLTLAGDQSAYEGLVVRYQKAVISSAISVTKNHFMAEDAAQDAFVTAWMKLNTLQETQKFGAWVCRIAKNCALNMLARYRGFLPLDFVDNLNISDDHSQNPSELYALSEERNEDQQKASKNCLKRCARSSVCTIMKDCPLRISQIKCAFPRVRSSGSFTTAENESERNFVQ